MSWYNAPLAKNTLSLLAKSGLLVTFCLLVIYASVRASSVLDAPVVSVRSDNRTTQGIVYRLPLAVQDVKLDWNVETCEYEPEAHLFDVVMSIGTSVERSIIPDQTLSYVLDERSLLDWAFSNSIGIKLTRDGFIQEFVLNSVADVIQIDRAMPTKLELHAVQIPPQDVPGLSYSVQDQCGSGVIAALKLRQDAKVAVDQSRQNALEAIADSVLSYEESRVLIPRFDESIKASGTGLVRPFPSSSKFGPVMKVAASLLSIDVEVEAVEKQQLPGDSPPATANGIVFRAPGLANTILCLEACEPEKRGSILLTSLASFPQLGAYSLIPVVRRPFSRLAVAITGTDEGGLTSVFLGEIQQVPGRPAEAKDDGPPSLDKPAEPPDEPE